MTNLVFHGRHYYQSGPDFTAILLSVRPGLYIDFIISPRQLYNKRNIFILRCLVTVIGESGFEAQAGQMIVTGYNGVCFETTLSDRHRQLDGVLFNLSPLSNSGFRDAHY